MIASMEFRRLLLGVTQLQDRWRFIREENDKRSRCWRQKWRIQHFLRSTGERSDFSGQLLFDWKTRNRSFDRNIYIFDLYIFWGWYHLFSWCNRPNSHLRCCVHFVCMKVKKFFFSFNQGVKTKLPHTTYLSPYQNYGCISTRFFWKSAEKLPVEKTIILRGQMIYREFFYVAASQVNNFTKVRTIGLRSFSKNILDDGQSNLSPNWLVRKFWSFESLERGENGVSVHWCCYATIGKNRPI